MKRLAFILAVLIGACASALTHPRTRALKDSITPREANLLGFRYYTGRGVPANKDSALFWLNRAARGGSAEALSNLGCLYADGELGPGRDSLAISLLTCASDRGVPEAAVRLSRFYLEGRSVAADTARAERLLAHAAQAGLHDAVPRLFAVEDPCLAARRGDTLVLTVMADALAFGRGVPRDPGRAFMLYLQSALAGHSRSRRIVAEHIEFFPDALRGPDALAVLRRWFAPDTVPDGVFHAWWWNDP